MKVYYPVWIEKSTILTLAEQGKTWRIKRSSNPII